ncbi:hypothetical protein C5167_008560 [Papaver somniferum]|uniref:UDP-glycosyltransferase n=1 Tax=Papaver somniferum TaxID=3469 RepID=A0A4Y7JYL5_PAPSO|nr:hypothetical protein C5167_008560 [Papaver somniferum]
MDKFVTKITTTIESPSYSSIPGGMQVTSSSSRYVLLFPFPTQGHLNPFLDFARNLASRIPYILIKIISTPDNIQKLRPRFLDYPTIDFVELPPFAENAENTENTLQMLITETLFHMSVEVAHSFGSRHVPLYTSGPYAVSIYNSIWTHLPHRLTPADVLTLPDLPPNFTIHGNQLSQNMIKAASSYTQDSPTTFAARQAEFCKNADGSLWNTVGVLEKFWLQHWENSSGRPVWAIGPVLPISSNEKERGGEDSCILVDQMMELAKGLERSEQRFIWVLRNPTGFEVGDKFRSEWLLHGFEERMKQKWQGFLTNGVPVIGWPLGSEQYYNSKLLEEELGVCLELARGFDANINGEDVAQTVRLVLEGDKGVKMRKKAEDLSQEMKKVLMKNGSSVQSLDNFVKTLRMWGEEDMKPR